MIITTCIASKFLSTLSLRRATTHDCGQKKTQSGISIHALLAESDHHVRQFTGDGWFISIHALLAESDFLHCTTYLNCSLFLSTLSLRRATVFGFAWLASCSYFYPRSPCGERLLWVLRKVPLLDFYPRSPCGERPSIAGRITSNGTKFLSTLSLRRATTESTPNRPEE